ncbi:hypothetical protein CBA19CS11_32385 [Caballeronia novacaledonica]|uniref:hypothetical protein n=1 Tax=Caballeronia novacaledonica TaxID=1544861 RepID=UPI001EE21460|nr:hypothetical protein [Caballeronia novacaledonica]GJH13637.1 hypothetical protein CBA19CS11_32385 [Caballeronia novacaledonica]
MATVAEVFRELAAEGGTARVTVISNQGDGISSYIVGKVIYAPRRSSAPKGGEAPVFLRDHLSSDGTDGQASFSDRFVTVDVGNGVKEEQPFSIRATNSAAIAIAPEGNGQGSKTWLVNIRLPAPFNRTLDFKANVDGSTLVGTSPTAIGITEHVDTAVYVVSLKRN